MMTIRELYFSNCDWGISTILEVIDGNVARIIYEGNYIEMPSEIRSMECSTFARNIIVTK